MAGPVALFRAGQTQTMALFRDAVERWREPRAARPMVSANSAAFHHLWSRLEPLSGTTVTEEDRFDAAISLLEVLADVPDAGGVPAVIEGEQQSLTDLAGTGAEPEDLVTILTETHRLQR
jgi:hypothetical protein